MSEQSPYQMTIGMSVLKQLGINLYSNISAVVSEVVANSWDADASNVWITMDRTDKKIIITDDGCGMDMDDMNNKYLFVGYDRRQDQPITAIHNRPVMGRKGIGKLSLFSIARSIELHSVKNGTKNGFRLFLDDIEQVIRDGITTYRPLAIHTNAIDIDGGTSIILSNLKKDLRRTEEGLKKRIARRFSIIGAEHDFHVFLNDEPITVLDRGYFHKIQYLWLYGREEDWFRNTCPHLQHLEIRSNEVPAPIESHTVSGWIATADQAGQLKDGDDNLNKIVIMVRGKLAQEDILESFTEGGVYSKYLFGEIHADFLDIDDRDDIATSSRQKIIEDDPRYLSLKSFLYQELKNIQNQWTDLRNLAGVERALEIPALKEWFEELKGDLKRSAQQLFGRINTLPIDSNDNRRVLFKQSVLAFESMRYKQNLDAIERITPNNLQGFLQVFSDYDDIEATLYYQIIQERLQVIRALKEKVEDNALEKVLQRHLYQHLWLLDPAWERATETPIIEEGVEKAFRDIDAGLTVAEKRSRLDIRYQKTSGKHLIIELKRAERTVSTPELLAQVRKYINALKKILRSIQRQGEPIECVCVVGRPLRDWADPDGFEESGKVLAAINARVVTYQGLIDSAEQAYMRYIEKQREAGRVYNLLRRIDEDEVGEDRLR